jgi:antibiotic biosynthesis monooxygenase (ABM) superfamily enzyme
MKICVGEPIGSERTRHKSSSFFVFRVALIVGVAGFIFVFDSSILTVYDSIGQMPTFLLFGAFCFIALLFVYYFVPETNGISLGRIEENLMKGKRIRNIGQPLSQDVHIVHPSGVSYNNRLD